MAVNILATLVIKVVTIDSSTEVVAADDCLSTTLDGESVILHVEAGEYYGFNEVATDVWESLQEPKTVREVCDDVVEAYDVDYERCRDDVDDLLVDLVERDLVRVDS